MSCDPWLKAAQKIYERQVDGKVQNVLNIKKICRLQKRDLEFTTNRSQIDKIHIETLLDPAW